MKAAWFMCLVLCAGAAQAEIYKWVDAEGKVHYSDKPVKADAAPMDIKAEAGTKPQVSQQDRLERRQRLLDAYDEDRAQRKEEEAKAAKQKQQLQRQCVIARDRLKRYESSSGLYDLDKDGNRILLPDKEKQRITESLRQQIAQNCN